MLKNEIKNYNHYIRYKIELEDMIENLWYELSGVKGVRYDKPPTLPNPTNERQLALIDKLDKYQSELTRVNIQIRYIDGVLDRMDKEDLSLIRYVLIDGHSLIEAGDKWGVTNTAISKRIDVILKKSLDGTFNN